MNPSILTIFKSQPAGINFECTMTEFETLYQEFMQSFPEKRGIVLRLDDQPYGDLKVNHYLEFFAQLAPCSRTIEMVIDLFELESWLQIKIDKLDETMRRVVNLAALLLVQGDYLWIYEPILEVSHPAFPVVVKALEKLSDENFWIICGSTSFRVLTLLSGHAYSWRHQRLIPLFEAIDEHKGLQDKPQPLEKLSIKVEGRTVIIAYADILYIESVDATSYIYIRNSSFPSTMTLDELERRLQGFGFFRCHRSYIVNVQRVNEIKAWTRNSYVLLVEHDPPLEIPLSKRRYQALQSLLHSEEIESR